MVDINKWLGYFSISIVMIVGILIVTGMVGDFDWNIRLPVGILVFTYVILRILFMRRSHRKPKTFRGLGVRRDYEKLDESKPNNT
ncbi:MAG TPA: hypothetical protein ENO22_06560 [candidate division Zixibacteria bacterium]|nr:hypothetical protein [candidate division Zixibacteria bacterium]HEQ98983.1 hypothetical protein [candidate division Zixibacteria bacterium]